jgi:hypothetical protein
MRASPICSAPHDHTRVGDVATRSDRRQQEVEARCVDRSGAVSASSGVVAKRLRSRRPAAHGRPDVLPISQRRQQTRHGRAGVRPRGVAVPSVSSRIAKRTSSTVRHECTSTGWRWNGATRQPRSTSHRKQTRQPSEGGSGSRSADRAPRAPHEHRQSSSPDGWDEARASPKDRGGGSRAINLPLGRSMSRCSA